jgi:hypothetical protein
MGTPLPVVLPQEATNHQIVNDSGRAPRLLQPPIQRGNQQKLIPDAGRLVTLLSDQSDISPDKRRQRA